MINNVFFKFINKLIYLRQFELENVHNQTNTFFNGFSYPFFINVSETLHLNIIVPSDLTLKRS